ncbi:TBC1 domain family member whacked [Stomoxys calcitrans]|uniref:TBC1 domain family member whacked n=1 Tax=Stomoxys calcitrans TaxID=35570 RepID=UPI0027E276AF|nr:TBC1 domain family member whacked [Stomoxys calcitrans]XP_013109746.2 TBC1 domain family member whacked [Stomoxys calcitrans]XP_013109747.2 TBC1 domain family member whacked [Stomoxys calcitrans]
MATSPRSADTISLCSTVSSCPDRNGFYGGFQRTDKPKEPLSKAQIIAREKKWLYMIDNWSLYMSKNYKKIRDRCRKGIPKSIRPRAWFFLSGAYLLKKKHPNLYTELLEKPGNPHVIEEIKKDKHRQFPFHEMFLDEDKVGQIELFNVLKAYSIYNPKVGFCQAQAPIAAFLLMHLPAEDAFWVFVSVCDVYLEDYFITGLEVLQNDAGILEGLLKKTCPPVYRHLQKHRVEPLLYMTDWFLCAMTRTLPWETLLRVWDCFLAEGIRVIFKVALVILGASLNSHKVRKQCNGLCETLEVLRNPPDNVLDEDFIINHMQRLNLRVEDFQIEHTRQKNRRAKQKALQEAAAAAPSTTTTTAIATNATATATATINLTPSSSSAATMAQSSNSQNNTFTRSRTTSPTNITSGSVTVVNIGGDDSASALGVSNISSSNGSVSVTANNYHT